MLSELSMATTVTSLERVRGGMRCWMIGMREGQHDQQNQQVRSANSTR